MRKFFFLLTLLLLNWNMSAQFKLDTEAYEKQKKAAEVARENRRIQDSLRLVQLEEQRIMANDVRFRIRWNSMLTFRQNIGFIENGYNISYYGYFSTKKTWTYPISIRLSSSKNYNWSALNDGYKKDEWSQYLTYLGMTGFRRIGGDFYFSLGGHVPLGWERYRYDYESSSDRKHTHLMTGLNAEERIFYMSPNKVGLVLGAGFYERVMTSKLYTVDLGLTLEVGIRF